LIDDADDWRSLRAGTWTLPSYDGILAKLGRFWPRPAAV
jgi:hypothetical protein